MSLWQAVGREFRNPSVWSFSFLQNTHIHTLSYLESKPQNSESETQNTSKPWTTTKSLFPHASYSHDKSSLQEPGVLPYSFLHHFPGHLCLNSSLYCSHMQTPHPINCSLPGPFPSFSAECYFSYAVPIFCKVIRFSHVLNIFPFFLKQLNSMLIFQKSIYSNVLISMLCTMLPP